MDSSLTIKSRPAVSPRGSTLRDPVAVREAIDTELEPHKIAAPIAADSGTGRDHPQDRHQGETSAHDVLIDPEARDALFSAVDVRTDHPEQSPNQALMAQRAYQQHQTSTNKSRETAS